MKIFILLLLLTVSAFSAWYGDFLSPNQLKMTTKNAGFFYGILGIVCGWAFVHHFRSF